MTAGPALPAQFYDSLLLGNLLQQTYSLVDAALLSENLAGINALAAVGASSSVIFLILGFLMELWLWFSIPEPKLVPVIMS